MLPKNLFDGFTIILALVSQVVLYTQVLGKKRISLVDSYFG